MKITFRLVFVALLLAVLLITQTVKPVRAATSTVTNANDSGAGSLRQAIADAAPGDTINFDASLTGAIIHLASTLTLAQDVTIDGSALAVPVTLSGDSDGDGVGDVTIFTINSGVTVVVNTLVLTRGNAVNDNGGAISNNGTLTVNNSILVENHAQDSSYSGGAIYSSSSLTVNNSKFLNNTAPYGGGAIQAVGTLNISNSAFSYSYTNSGGGGGAIYSAATTTITNSTFTHNTAATVNGGGIYVVAGTTTVKGSTFAYNSAGAGASIAVQTGTLNVSNSTFTKNTTSGIAGGIYNYGTVNLYNSTFSDNSAVVGTDLANFGTFNFANNIMANTVSGSGLSCYNTGSISTNTNNLIEDTSPTCSPTLSVDPNLAALANNGGSTQTMALLSGSPAIDAGDNTTCATSPVSNADQRGVTRPLGINCDLGAYEADYLTVTKAADTNDGTCDSDCSLREAVTAANADANLDTILFNGDYTITLTSNLPTLNDAITVDGQGHAIVLDGASNYYMFDANYSVSLKNLTIQNAHYGNGGALVLRAPSSIENVSFLNNTATSNGGAIYILSTIVDIRNSTFSGNTSGGGGGAIKNDAGTLTITNSTFDNNSSSIGGAIIALGGSTTLLNSTISGSSGGAVYNNGTLNLANTVIANSTGSDCANDGTTGFNLNNLVEDGTCSASFSGDPKLGTLANNGGITSTLALLANSTAINAGNDAACLLVNSLDQRGTNRPNGPKCDLGAYEYVDTTAPTVTAFTVPATSASLSIAISAFTASDDTTVSKYLVTGTSSVPAVDNAGWSSNPLAPYVVASAGAYTLYPWVKDAAGNISAVYGSPISVTVDTTAPTVSSIARVDTNPTAKVSVKFTVTFSESVTGLTTADFSLTTSGVTGAAITGVTGAGATRTVTVKTGSGNGTIRLNIPASATITDGAGNSIAGLPYISGPSYTVNKTLTFTSVGMQDGWILESSETSNLGGTLNSTAQTFNLGDDAAKKQYRGILSFNTADLPDNAIITGVTLKVKQNGSAIGGGNPVSIFQGFMVDIKTGCYSNLATLQMVDFQAVASKTYGPFTSSAVSAWYSFNLLSGKGYINKLTTNGGLTQIRLRFKLDDNNNTLANYLSLFSGNATSTANRPQLLITYYVP